MSTSKKLTAENLEDLKSAGNQYVVITMGYRKLLLPFAEGVQVLTAMKQAETISAGEIKPFESDDLSFTLFSREEYVNAKMKKLLGVKET